MNKQTSIQLTSIILNLLAFDSTASRNQRESERIVVVLCRGAIRWLARDIAPERASRAAPGMGSSGGCAKAVQCLSKATTAV